MQWEEAAPPGLQPRPGSPSRNHAGVPDPGELSGRPAGGLQRGNCPVCPSHCPAPHPQRLPPGLWNRSSGALLLGRTQNHSHAEPYGGFGGGRVPTPRVNRETSKGPLASSYAGHGPSLAASLSPEDRTRIQRPSPSRRGGLHAPQGSSPRKFLSL